MSEEKKKLGVEDLVKAQQETAEQLKIIAERLEWLCDAEMEPYHAGCLWIWLVPACILFLAGGGFASDKRAEGLLGIIALSLIILVAVHLRDTSKTPRRQVADRLKRENVRKKEERYFEERQRMLEERIAKKAQAKKDKFFASRPKIKLKKED